MSLGLVANINMDLNIVITQNIVWCLDEQFAIQLDVLSSGKLTQQATP